MKELKIGDLVAKIPIIQGGMGVGISLSGLASAVANEGGIGVIATVAIGMNEPDYFTNFFEANIRAFKKEIQKARDASKGIIGVNIMGVLTNFADFVKTSIEEKIDIIFSGASLPLSLPKFLKEGCKTKLVPIVSSARAAKIIIEKWSKSYNYFPDAIVVEGPEAGGHLGFKTNQIENEKFALDKILAEVISTKAVYEKENNIKIPVIAAGGIYSGQDIHKFIEMGADGVQMGTRFVTTDECDASIKFKESYINAQKKDIIIIKSPVGLPGRAIVTKFIEKVAEGKKKPTSCPVDCIRTCNPETTPYCIFAALVNAQKGKLDNGLVFAGSNAFKSDRIISVKELVADLVSEYNEAEQNSDTIT